jgi:hypothetical protein
VLQVVVPVTQHDRDSLHANLTLQGIARPAIPIGRRYFKFESIALSGWREI